MRERERTLKRELLLLPLVNFLRRVSTGNRAWEIFTSEATLLLFIAVNRGRARGLAPQVFRLDPSTLDCRPFEGAF